MRLRAAPPAPYTIQVGGQAVLTEETTTTYALSVDGGPLRTIEVSADEVSYELARDLDPRAEHEVAVTRNAEASAGVHQLLGFDVDDGTLEPPRARRRRLEIVGDSITCGYGILGADATCAFSYGTERASLAYGAIVGRALDCDVTTVCYSGRGVLRNYDGTTEGTMPELFERTLPDSPAALFDFGATEAPDGVITMLGTNDVLGQGPLDAAAFEAAYVRFLVRVRAVYPGAFVIVVQSPMIPPEPVPGRDGDTRALARSSLERIVAARHSDGDGRVSFLGVPYQGTRVGCDCHPNGEMHRVMARAIEASVRGELGPLP